MNPLIHQLPQETKWGYCTKNEVLLKISSNNVSKSAGIYWRNPYWKPSFFCGVRLDVCPRGFLQAGQLAFFDVRVFNTNARRYVKQELSNAYKTNEKF